MKTNPIIAVTTLNSTTTVASSGTVYSDIDAQFYKAVGFAGALIGVYGDGGNTSMTITQQCSLNGTDWYDPKDASNTAIGSVASTFTSTSGVTTWRYIQFNPVLSPQIRFKTVEGGTGNGKITIKLFYQN